MNPSTSRRTTHLLDCIYYRVWRRLERLLGDREEGWGLMGGHGTSLLIIWSIWCCVDTYGDLLFPTDVAIMWDITNWGAVDDGEWIINGWLSFWFPIMAFAFSSVIKGPYICSIYPVSSRCCSSSLRPACSSSSPERWELFVTGSWLHLFNILTFEIPRRPLLV